MPASMSGLDLSFLRKNDPHSCQPGRYRFDAEDGVVPADVHARKHRKPNKRSTKVACPMFMPDVDQAYGGAWKSIIDGTEISSRTNWREHNKRNGVSEVGPGYWGENKGRDIVDITAERMGHDPSLVNSDVFTWKDPVSVRGEENGRKDPSNGIVSGKRGRSGRLTTAAGQAQRQRKG